MANDKQAPAAGRVQIENLGRCTWRFTPSQVVNGELVIDHSKDVVVGDKKNADALEQLHEQVKTDEDRKRLQDLFPSPLVSLPAQHYEALGPGNHQMIEALVKKGEFRLTRQAA